MTRPLKILFLMEDLCFGGTQKQTLALAARLDRKRFAPHMLTLRGPADLDKTASENGIPLKHMGKNRGLAPFFFAALAGEIKKIAPDILVPCTALPNIWGRIWGRLLRIPLVIGTIRGGGAPRRQHEFILWRLTDHLIYNSPAHLERMTRLGAPQSHLSFIPNGVDTDFFHPQEDKTDTRNILCAARLCKDKDHITLFKAFAIVAREFPDATLCLAGDGPEAGNLKAFVSASLDASVAKRVHFAGSSLDMRPHYAAARILALSSIRDAMPNVILEGMACGLPVCATRVGAIPMLVREKRNGLLSAPGDAAALAANLKTLLANPERAREYGRIGRDLAEKNFSFNAMVQAHEELFLRLWNQKHTGD